MTTPHAVDAGRQLKGVLPQHRRAALSALSGQAIEYYDFFLFGTAAAVVLGRVFFPSADPVAGTLAAFATFAAGFLVRPIGAIVFGHLGDRIGRKSVLVVTLMLMGGATTAIGALPTYDMVGVWAPIGLVFLRCIQGFAIGGEWGGASLVALEHAPKGRAAFYSSIAQLGSPLGLMASTLMVLLFGTMSDEAFLAWGWRVPFLFSAVLLVVGLAIRLRLSETPAFIEVKQTDQRSRWPIADLLRTAWRPLLIGTTITLLSSGGWVLINTFTIGYAVSHLGLDREIGLTGQFITAIIKAALLLFVGYWAIRRQPRLIAGAGAALIAVWAFPLYLFVDTGVPTVIWIGQGIATVFETLMSAVLPALLAAQFPVHLRYTGISLCYQGGNAIGGLTPVVATYLVEETNASWPLATLLAVLGVISALACLSARGNTLDLNAPRTTASQAGNFAPVLPVTPLGNNDDGERAILTSSEAREE
ncbi:MHS family MFS transporter [Nocardia amamiensis]|uniref:MHS family MFS transporter n=1 Tax=Nocardia amamiensis TaxID=404578 RepID=A0ABS0D6M4_9NOCA|nr:MFS transporter [Nocardia amamiensis]MBF6302773.1 MHS family MFS transporter [Nocardia amamiensis]